MDKKELRRHIRGLKGQYTRGQKMEMSRVIWEKLEKEPLFRQAQVLLLYWSMEDEPFTPDFIRRWCTRKTILLPCVRGDALELRRYAGEESLFEGEHFGIPEPTGECFTEYGAIDLIIVPGVAFDASGNRLGRGKGYYDKLLEGTPRTPKIGICFDFQFFPEIPTDEWDVKMDLVVR